MCPALCNIQAAALTASNGRSHHASGFSLQSIIHFSPRNSSPKFDRLMDEDEGKLDTEGKLNLWNRDNSAGTNFLVLELEMPRQSQ